MLDKVGLSRDVPLASTRSCILLVEDEVLIRIMLSDELREAGYDVIEACDAEEGLQILQSSVEVDLIVSDVRMPGSLDGLGLLALVRESSPTLPVIITSGHLHPNQALAEGAADFLRKPFAMADLLSAVRRELMRPNDYK